MLRRTFALCLLSVVLAGAEAGAACVSYVERLDVPSNNFVPGPGVWTGDRYLLAGHDGSPKAIYVSGHTAEGAVTLPPTLVASGSMTGPVKLLWNGFEAALFYARDGAIIFQRLTAAGEVISEAVQIPLSRNHQIGDVFDVAWDPVIHAYILGRTSSVPARRAWAVLIEASGALRREEQISITPTSKPALRVATNGTGAAGIFYNAADGTMAHVPVRTTGLIGLRNPWTAGEDLLVEAVENRFVLVRSGIGSGGKRDIRWTTLGIDDFGVATEKVLVAGDRDVTPLGLLVTETEMALAYLEGVPGSTPASTYRLRRMTHGGALIHDAIFTAADVIRWYNMASSFDPVWTGDAYLHTVARTLPSRVESYLTRLCPLRAGIAGTAYVRNGEPVTFAAIPDGGVPGYEFSWAFGDRNTSKKAEVEHTYSRPGIYEVDLTVEDSKGETARATFVVHVVEPKRRSVRN